MEKVAIYIRVSSKEQIEGSSLETQERVCSDFAFRNGCEIVKIFREEGESAKTADRTRLKELLDFVGKNSKQLSAVIIYKVDRLARNTLDFAELKLFFRTRGVKLISATENLEDSPVGRLIENQLAGFAQFDNEVRAERCTAGMVEAVKKGRYVWKAPVGYVNVGGKGDSNIAPDKEDTVRMIHKSWELVDIGFTVEEARRSITKEGLKGKSGKPISRAHFYSMFKNKIYMGVIEKFGLSIIGSFPPIIEPDLFTRVADKMSPTNKKIPIYKKDNEDFPLRGLVTCSHCGNRMTASWSRGNGGKYAFYRCIYCHKVNYKKELVENKFIEYLRGHSYKPELKNMLIKAIEANLEFRNEANAKRAEEIQKEIKKEKAKASQIVEKNLSNVINDNLAKELLEANQEKLSGLSLELKQYEIDSGENIELIKHSLSILEDISGVWLDADFEIKKRFQKFLFPQGVSFDGQEFGTTKLPICISTILYNLSKKSCLVDPSGFEPLTSSLPAMRSSQLNYGP